MAIGNFLDDLFRFGGRATVRVADTAAATVLTEDQQRARIIEITGTLTAGRTLRMPLKAGADWVIKNSTTGGFAVTVAGESGASVSVAAGDQKQIFCDGTGFSTIAAASLAVSKTGSVNLARSLFSLQGGVSANEQDVRDVVNAAISELSLTRRVANVKAYGARGDGATGSSAMAAETAAIQAALDTKDTVYFPRGTYRVSGTLRPYSSQVVYGDNCTRDGGFGGASIIQSAEAALFRGANFPGRTRFTTILGLTLEHAVVANALGVSGGAGHDTRRIGIDAGGWAHFLIKDCSFRYFHKAISVSDTGVAGGAYTTASVSVGQLTIAVDNTTYFAANDWVTLSHHTVEGSQTVQIDSVGALSITLKTPSTLDLPGGALVYNGTTRYGAAAGYYGSVEGVEIGNCTYGVHGVVANSIQIRPSRIHNCRTGVHLERSGGTWVHGAYERNALGVRLGPGSNGCRVSGYFESNGNNTSSYWPGISHSAARELGGVVFDQYAINNVADIRVSAGGDTVIDLEGTNENRSSFRSSAPCMGEDYPTGGNLFPAVEIDSDSDGLPDGWQISAGSGYAHSLDSAIFSTIGRGPPAAPVTGSKALKLEITGATSGRRILYTAVDELVEGEVYTVSGYIACDADGANKFALFFGPDTARANAYVSSGIIGGTNSHLYPGGWHRVQGTFVARRATTRRAGPGPTAYDSDVAFSGTSRPIRIRIATGGVRGTLTFDYSTDEGASWTGPVASVASSSPVAIGGTGVSVAFTSALAYTAGTQYLWTVGVHAALEVYTTGLTAPGAAWVSDLVLVRGRKDVAFQAPLRLEPTAMDSVPAGTSIPVRSKFVKITGASTTITHIAPPANFSGAIQIYCENAQTIGAGTSRGAVIGAPHSLAADRAYTLVFDASRGRWLPPELAASVSAATVTASSSLTVGSSTDYERVSRFTTTTTDATPTTIAMGTASLPNCLASVVYEVVGTRVGVAGDYCRTVPWRGRVIAGVVTRVDANTPPAAESDSAVGVDAVALSNGDIQVTGQAATTWKWDVTRSIKVVSKV